MKWFCFARRSQFPLKFLAPTANCVLMRQLNFHAHRTTSEIQDTLQSVETRYSGRAHWFPTMRAPAVAAPPTEAPIEVLPVEKRLAASRPRPPPSSSVSKCPLAQCSSSARAISANSAMCLIAAPPNSSAITGSSRWRTRLRRKETFRLDESSRQLWPRSRQEFLQVSASKAEERPHYLAKRTARVLKLMIENDAWMDPGKSANAGTAKHAQ